MFFFFVCFSFVVCFLICLIIDLSYVITDYVCLPSQVLFILYLNTWTMTLWVCLSLAWFILMRATSSLSCASYWRALITATRKTFCIETSSAPTSCLITSRSLGKTLNTFMLYRMLNFVFRLKCNHCSFHLIRGQIKLADFGLARLYNSEERWALKLSTSFLVGMWPSHLVLHLTLIQLRTLLSFLFIFLVDHTPIKWSHFGTVPQSYFWEKRGTRRQLMCGAAGKNRTHLG